MGKYSRLGTYLREQGKSLVPLTFAEIERVVGFKLPKSQEYQAWWSNSTSNNVMTQVWLDAGYRTEQVDTTGKRIVFRKVGLGTMPPSSGGMSENLRKFDDTIKQNGPRHSPLFGALKGTFTIEAGYDLTAPAMDPKEWNSTLETKLSRFGGGQ
jgi:hypothetical protein